MNRFMMHADPAAVAVLGRNKFAPLQHTSQSLRRHRVTFTFSATTHCIIRLSSHRKTPDVVHPVSRIVTARLDDVMTAE